MPVKLDLKYGFKAEAERISVNFRQEIGVSKYDPLDAFALADHMQIPIITVDEFDEIIPIEDLRRLRDPEQFSAMWMPNNDGERIIIHNQYHSGKRQQSNLMHELAHIHLNHEVSDEAAKLCLTLGLHYFNKVQEDEAKYLGGCLQISQPGILWSLKQGKSIQEISDHYNASIDMVQFRINCLGLGRRRPPKNKIT